MLSLAINNTYTICIKCFNVSTILLKRLNFINKLYKKTFGLVNTFFDKNIMVGYKQFLNKKYF